MNKEKVEMTKEEIDYKLNSSYIGKVVTYTQINNKEVSGKVQRITVDFKDGELMVIFMMDYKRYECDLQYFLENVTRHGNTPGTETGSTRLQEGD